MSQLDFQLSPEQLEWLKQVSRTFYISIRFLPRTFRGILGYNYLLCRFLDIFEDCEDLPLDQKKELLRILRRIVEGTDDHRDYQSRFLGIEKKYSFSDPERILIRNYDPIFKILIDFPADIKSIIGKWVGEMAEGMAQYAFPPGGSTEVLQQMSDLERYIYAVAGTVGGLISDLLALRLSRFHKDRSDIVKYAINYGKGLQLVNIIKDSRADYLENRCYIPIELFQANQCLVESFYNTRSSTDESCLNIYRQLVEMAEAYLLDARRFIRYIPRHHLRLRFSCILPMVLADSTLSQFKRRIGPFIKENRTFKISKRSVRYAMFKSLWLSLTI